MAGGQDKVVIAPTPKTASAIGLPIPATSQIRLANSVDDPNAMYPDTSLTRFLRLKDHSYWMLVRSIHLSSQRELCLRVGIEMLDNLSSCNEEFLNLIRRVISFEFRCVMDSIVACFANLIRQAVQVS